MAEIEAELMCKVPGTWRSFEELEECLTMEELTLLLSTHTKIDNSNREFTAALKGIDLSGNVRSHEDASSSFEEKKRAAAAKAAGMDQDEYDFAAMGLDLVEIG